MSLLKYNGEDYYDNNENLDGVGYYQFITLIELVDDFMITKVGGSKLIKSIPRHIVEWHTQRAIQELNYDVQTPIKTWEDTLIGVLSLQVPQDLIKVNSVSWMDNNGFRHMMDKQNYTSNADEPLRDSDGNFIYDFEGNLMMANQSASINNWQNNGNENDAADDFYNYYSGSFENDELYDRYYSYYGRRYGSDPATTNINGTYVYDAEIGRIFFDMTVAERAIQVDYISDGLGVDKSKVRAHKYSEEAIYDYVKWKILSNEERVPNYAVEAARREYYASKKRTKLRVSDINAKALFKVMKGKSKWVKN